MKIFNHKFIRKLASMAYSAGVVSLIIGVIFSFTTQPVYATPGGVDKIWICHVTPGNYVSINVDADGWNGHDGHPNDFLISGQSDPACSAPSETEVTPTATIVPPTPTNTSEPKGDETTATVTLTVTATEESHKIWICHIPPGDTENPLALNVDAEGWNGHDNHELDFVIDGPDDPTCAAPGATATATEEPTATATPTETPTEVPTLTPTVTEVPFARLSLGYICAAPQQQWTVSNPNNSSVQFTWSLSSGGSGSGTVPANSSLTFSTAGGFHTMTINWSDPGEQSFSLSSTTSETSPCPSTTKPTKTPGGNGGGEETPLIPVTGGARQATFVSTLPPQAELLIPVTGRDFSNPFSGTPLGSLFLKFGAIFLGFAFLTHGVSYKLKDN